MRWPLSTLKMLLRKYDKEVKDFLHSEEFKLIDELGTIWSGKRRSIGNQIDKKLKFCARDSRKNRRSYFVG